MSKFHLVAALLIAGAVVAPVVAQTTSIAYTPQQVVAARQASLAMSSADFGAMLAAAKGGAEAKTQGGAAKSLALWAKVLPTLFPAGTAMSPTLDTKAKPEIWTDHAGFEKAAADYIAATQQLSTLAEANDTAGFTAQLDQMKEACGACHKAYRAR
jgi:cytochrome c556